MSRVLIVDDDEDSCASLSELCRSWGHEVWSALNGHEALGLHAAFDPDVVILDLALPSHDGWAVARQMRARQAIASTSLRSVGGRDPATKRGRCWPGRTISFSSPPTSTCYSICSTLRLPG